MKRARPRRFAAVAVGLVVMTLITSIVVAMGCEDVVDFCQPYAWVDGIPDPTLCGCRAGFVCSGKLGRHGECPKPFTCVPDVDAGACPGQCVPGPPSTWDLPGLLWIGPELEAPSCPGIAPQLGYEGHADLNAPNVCGDCTCAPPSGSCSLPATLTESAASCATVDSSTPHVPFDPPAGWDGNCSSNDSVDADQLCDGGACDRSLTIAPPTLSETGCAPAQLPVPAIVPPTWKTFGRLCRGFPPGACSDWGHVCVAPAVPGFRVCIVHDGDKDCPVPEYGPYQEKHILYGGLSDTRACSTCTCGSPSGSLCTTEVSVYDDPLCATVPSYMVTVDSTKASCVDLAQNGALGSKSASLPTFTPGVCQPAGGVPSGSADPIDPVTLCCIP